MIHVEPRPEAFIGLYIGELKDWVTARDIVYVLYVDEGEPVLKRVHKQRLTLVSKVNGD